MPDPASILLKVSADAADLKKIFAGFNEAKVSVKSFSQEVDAVSGKLSAMGSIRFGAGLAAGAAAVRSAFSALKESMIDTVVQGVKFNASLEQARLGIASVLKTFNPEKFSDFNAAIAQSGVLIEQLRKKALETPATFDELLTAFQGSAGAMNAANIPLARQVDLITNMSQALTALGISTQELRQETTALLTGNIDRNARAAQTLGITSADIANAKAKGQLYEFLSDKLSAFSEASRLAATNVNVLESNLKDATTQIAAEGTKELTESYRSLLVSLTDLVRSPAFSDLVGMLATVAKQATDAATAITQLFSTPIQNANLTRARATATDISEARTVEAQRLAVSRARAQWRETSSELDELLAKRDQLSAAGSAGKNFGLAVLAGPLAGLVGANAADEARERKLVEDKIKVVTEARNTLAAALELQSRNGAELLMQNASLDEQAKKENDLKNTNRERARLSKEIAEDYAKNVENAEKAAFAAKSDFGKLQELNRLIEQAKIAVRLSPTAESFAGVGKAPTDENKMAATSARLEAEARLNELLRAREVVQKRIDTDRERADAKAAAESKKAEENRIRAEQFTLRDAIAAAKRAQDAEIARINDDRTLTDKERRARLYLAYKQEEKRLEEQIAAARAVRAKSPAGSSGEEAAQEKLDGLLTRKEVGLPSDLKANQPKNFAEDLEENFAKLKDSFVSIADVITNTMGAAIEGITGSIVGLVKGTMTWGMALRNIGGSILDGVISGFARMFAQWIVGRLLMSQVSKAASISEGATDAAAKAPGALLTSVSSFGVAAAVGAAALIAAMAMFNTGGYTGHGGELEPAGIVHKGEVVFSQRDIARFGGVAAVEQMRVSGKSPLATSMAAASAAGPAVGTAGGTQVNQAFFDNRPSAETWLQSQPGRRFMTDYMRQLQHEL